MLLIYPPVVKPCEPPPGMAKLAGALSGCGLNVTILDANIEGLLALLGRKPFSSDRWTSRAYRNSAMHLASLGSLSTYGNVDKYSRAVHDLNRLLEKSCTTDSVRLGLSNYQDSVLSPVRSNDLLRAAEIPERNPFYFYFQKRLSEILEKEQHSIIGFSLNYLGQALCTFAMMGFLRRTYPELKLVAGGGLITSWIRRPNWNSPFNGLIDELVAGPGEDYLLSISGINGSGAGHHVPDYECLPRSDYLSPGFILPYSASSGCYWNKCSFCPERAEKNPYIPVPKKTAIEELHHLVEKNKPSLIHILDNAISPALMKALCKSPPGVPWYGFARVTRHFADEDFCMELSRSGCIMLKLGLESGDQNVLDKEQKGMDLDLASKALTNLKKAGIGTYVYLLFGTPSETLAEARKTLEFTATHSEWIDFLNLAIFNLPIHSPDARGLDTEVHYDGDLSLYTGFSHPKGWNRGLVRQFLDKEFKRHPAIARILRRDPPIFTSNHAPYFVSSK